MIRVICRHADGTVEVDAPIDTLPALLANTANAVWVDMQASTDIEYRQVLEGVFHFHPLAIEDAITDLHVPKLDDYGAYLYLVFHTVNLGEEPMDIDTEEVDVFPTTW